MTPSEFQTVSGDLAAISSQIPLRWGSIQNDQADAGIDMFSYQSFEALQQALSDKPISIRDYFKKRWFIWRCAQCDEYLFYSQEGILPNPNPYDQAWDIEFFGRVEWRFDIKGTVVPAQFREGTVIPRNTMSIIEFNYERQSQGVRHKFQNRLFIVHLPLNPNSENLLRANFDAKRLVFKKYIETLRQKPNYTFFEYRGVKTDLIYIVEEQRGQVSHYFASVALNEM